MVYWPDTNSIVKFYNKIIIILYQTNTSQIVSQLSSAPWTLSSLSVLYIESFGYLPGSCRRISDMVRVTVKELQILNSFTWWKQSIIMFGSDVRKFGLLWCVYLAVLLFIQCFLGEKRKSSDFLEIIHLESCQFEACYYTLLFAIIISRSGVSNRLPIRMTPVLNVA